MLVLHNLKKPKGNRSKKRVGRGNASGHGTYSTRGIKGQRSRSGGKGGLKIKGFKQLLSSIPKLRGFKRLQEDVQIVNVSELNNKFFDNSEINVENLYKKGLIKTVKKGVKVLGNGELKVKGLKVSGCEVSKSAREKIEKNGGAINS
ncbi:50S ribosomal protein L15 [Candidatus Falkowbacteria bacterium RBG_13_39_14]|uniref:Large ribosomal subunit protein uL15 n=1 Tax=Candidatus Falkowbacteria bacterium RBG_13_39_14 TaxID=1797985 RepID=A0A1F5S3H5_9BACT|nr:MAG: 50S ribosomal protein L15 [Candidatus Falkowbacteria bacterium RBG_13_39_14]